MDSLSSVGVSDDEDQQEKTLSQVYDRLPEGRTPLDILRKKEERGRIGKSEHRAHRPVNNSSPHLTLPVLLSDIRHSFQAKHTFARPSRVTRRL